MFIEYLNNFIVDNEVDFVMPAHDSVILRLGSAQDRLRAQVVGSPAQTCEICRSKKKTYEVFRDKLRVPAIIDISGPNVSLPIFLKPDVGQGSKGTVKVESVEEALIHMKQNPSLLPLEYLPGEEFTVDCFTDGSGNLLFAEGRRRIRIMNGIAVDTEPARDSAFQAIARTIQSTMRFRGAWFFQLKRAVGNELALLEIAPRIAGSMAMYRNLGVNFALLSLYDRMGMRVGILKNQYSIRMDRALTNRFEIGLTYGHVYVDLDDAVIIEGQVNVVLVAFLYQCRNRGIEVNLITRHSGPVNQVLKKYRLSELFDRVIHMDEETPKSANIVESNAIFIDDSFSERLEVAEKCGIATFSVDMIECLVDWKR